MKIILAFLIPFCIYIGALGINDTIISISKGEFDAIPLLWAIIAIDSLILIILYEVQGGKGKSVLNEQRPPMSKAEFEIKLEKKIKNSNYFLIAITVCAIVFLISPIMLLIKEDSEITFILLFFPSMLELIVLSIVYSTKYSQLKANLKLLEKVGVTLDSCLNNMENSPVTPKNRVICTENAMISELNMLVMPYSAIAWMHRTDTSINGISVGSYWKIYTFTGKCFSVSMDNDEVQTILNFFSNKFSEKLILGFGNQQSKAYKELKKEYKNLY